MEFDLTKLLTTPLCHCNTISSKCTVQKDTPNKGRVYYRCEKNVCDYHQWDNEIKLNNQDQIITKERRKPLKRKVFENDFEKNIDIHWAIPMYSSKAMNEIIEHFKARQISFTINNIIQRISLGYDFVLKNKYTVHVIFSPIHWRNYKHSDARINIDVPSPIKERINNMYHRRYKERGIIKKPKNEDGFWILKNDYGCHIKSPLKRNEIDYFLFYLNPMNLYICHRQSINESFEIESMMENDTCIYISKEMVKSADIYSEILNKIKD